jgi:hypothetical protein
MSRFPPTQLGVNGYLPLHSNNERNRLNKVRKRERKNAAMDRENERRDMANAAAKGVAQKESAVAKRLAKREKEFAELDTSLTVAAMQSHIIVINKLTDEIQRESDPERRKELLTELQGVKAAGLLISDAYNARMSAGGSSKAPDPTPAPVLAPAPKRVPIVFKEQARTAKASGVEKSAGGTGIFEKSGTFHNTNNVIFHLPPKEVKRKRTPPPPGVDDMLYDYDTKMYVDE